jgi:hypothetical protein
MEAEKDNQPVLSVMKGYSSIAIWQGAAFFLLLLMVWFNEIVDVASLLAGRPASPPDVFRGCIATAGVFFGAIVTIGHTYVQQRRIMSGMLTICCYCHNIRIKHAIWQRIEEYIGKHSTAIFSHGVCPECFEKAKQEVNSPAPPASGNSISR